MVDHCFDNAKGTDISRESFTGGTQMVRTCMHVYILGSEGILIMIDQHTAKYASKGVALITQFQSFRIIISYYATWPHGVGKNIAQ